MFVYIVRCTFENAEIAERWLRWLAEEHLTEVCAAGALDAEAIRLDSVHVSHGSADHVICEARYHFSNRVAFEQYEREHAPRLRAEGLKLFPLEMGLKYERLTGELRGECRKRS